MANKPPTTVLSFPCDPPRPGEVTEIAPGILWARIALPYAPGHVNSYLIEDVDGWVAVDAGLDDEPTRATWDRILSEALGGRPLTRVLITHWHSDHMGLGGWLCERFGAQLLMSECEYLHGVVRKFTPQDVKDEIQRRFFLAHGLDPTTTEEWVATGHHYLEMPHPVPRTFKRLMDGDSLQIGGRHFQVLTAAGHSPEAVMLFCPDDKLFLCADQIISRTVTNIAVQAFEPDGDPLGVYLRSLDRLERTLPGDTLLLPGHEGVYRGMPQRIAELKRHFAARCATIVAACRDVPRTAGDLLPVLFRKPLGSTWVGFIVSDLVSHLNHMARQGTLSLIREDSQIKFLATGDNNCDGT